MHIVIRALIALIVLFVLMRIIGKKQLAQVTYFEYIVGIVVGDIAAFVSTDMENNLAHGYTSLLVWTVVPFVVSYLTLKSKWLRDVIEGKTTVLIKNGKIMEDNLMKVHFSTDELLAELRLKDAFQLADVEFAALETNGKLSVLLKKDAQPATVKDLKVKAAPMRESQAVIMDGVVMLEPLTTIGLNTQWLHEELTKAGVSLENVFLAQIDSNGQLYLDLYDDQVKVSPPVDKQLVLASLKKCLADTELFALATNTPQAKQMYAEMATEIQRMIKELTPYLS
ncbi:MAG TPA: DUF421 domain-containing protein [Bacillota bacterium]|nr:DUF421 domain-containing protein [Bacillota bacterium]